MANKLICFWNRGRSKNVAKSLTQRTDSTLTNLDKKDQSHESLPLLYLCLGMIMGLGKRDIPRFEDGKERA
jgi:hypothetical protein